MKKYKLKYRNNWENHEYYVMIDRKEKILEKIKEVIIVQHFSGAKYKRHTYPVYARIEHVTCHDMGHEYSVATKQFFIKSMLHGIEIEIPLKKFLSNATHVEVEL